MQKINHLERYRVPLLDRNLRIFENPGKGNQFFTACSNIMFEESTCQKSDHLLNQTFTVALRENGLKVTHAKISGIFSRNKNASTEPHN